MPHLFLPFKADVSKIPLPEKFTFPFYYSPHKLAEIASKELQEYIDDQTEWKHNFGLLNNQEGFVIGKMFGVLVCQNQKGELGQLWAFSGKLAEGNHWSNFVPPVFDMLSKDGFFKKEEAVLNQYNTAIKNIENAQDYAHVVEKLNVLKREAAKDIDNQKKRIKTLKVERDQKRVSALEIMSSVDFEVYSQGLSEESKKESILLKKMTKYWRLTIEDAEKEVSRFTDEISTLKVTRRAKSAALQQRLFEKYTFLNVAGEEKSVGELFDDNPPAGAGECTAPKLLQYAFLHHLKPVALAEFWWGTPPKSEVRKHKHFYPACKLKCEPILMEHMLKGLEMDENPFLQSQSAVKTIDIVYEDDAIMLVNKPHELLSVPGKQVTDSVYERIKALRPNASGPLLVHRLDMSTSGLLIIAKDEQAHKMLQRQFIQRTIKKRYIALLDGVLKASNGEINLPLRVDLDDRPRQLVCYEHGKAALTEYEVVKVKNKQTYVHFYPVTGRTHQLRVHASHHLGLDIPIVGDDLYGKKVNRLHLHAEWIRFVHPVTREEMEFSVACDF